MWDSLLHSTTWVLFAWVLANQGGVPVPVSPLLLTAGALAGGGSLSFTTVLAVGVGAALSADVVWYSVGRWRGLRVLAVLLRLVRRPLASVDQVERVFRTHRLGYLWSARFLPELNPVAAGLAGATRLRPALFLLHAVGSAILWTGAWAGSGFVFGEILADSVYRVGVLNAILIAGALSVVSISVVKLVGSCR